MLAMHLTNSNASVISRQPISNGPASLQKNYTTKDQVCTSPVTELADTIGTNSTGPVVCPRVINDMSTILNVDATPEALLPSLIEKAADDAALVAAESLSKRGAGGSISRSSVSENHFTPISSSGGSPSIFDISSRSGSIFPAVEEPGEMKTPPSDSADDKAKHDSSDYETEQIRIKL